MQRGHPVLADQRQHLGVGLSRLTEQDIPAPVFGHITRLRARSADNLPSRFHTDASIGLLPDKTESVQ